MKYDLGNMFTDPNTSVIMKILSLLSCLVILPWPLIFYLSFYLIVFPKVSSDPIDWLLAILLWGYPLIVYAILYTGYRVSKHMKLLGALIASLPMYIGMYLFISLLN